MRFRSPSFARNAARLCALAAALVLSVPSGAAAGDAAAARRVTIDCLSLPAQIYIEGLCAGVTPCTVPVRKGDRIRVVDDRGPEHPIVYTYCPLRKSHISGYETSQFTLVYPYGGEETLRFTKRGACWYLVEADRETVVGVDTTSRGAKLPEAAAQKPAYLWVKAEAENISKVAEAVKDLPSVGLQIRRPSDETIGAISAIKGLRVLCLSGPDGDHAGVPSTLKNVSPLADLPGLEKLNMDGCVAVSDISPLAKLSGLTTLCLEQCGAVKDVSSLSSMKNLRTLSPPPSVTDDQLAQICRDHPGLTHMNLEYCTGLTDISPLAGLAGLEALNLEGCSGLKSVDTLSGLKGLRILGMAPTKTVDKDLEGICRDHPDLACISFGYTAVGNLSPLAGMRSLQWLYIGKPEGKGSVDYAPVSGLKNLRAFNLNGCRVSDLKFLSGLTSLKALVLRQTHTLEDLGPLAGLTEIEYLSTRYGKEIEDISPLAGMTKMRNLQLRMCQAADLSPLSGMKDLSYLDLTECDRFETLKPLYGLRSLRFLTGGSFTKEDLEAFRKAVPDCGLGRVGRRK